MKVLYFFLYCLFFVSLPSSHALSQGGITLSYDKLIEGINFFSKSAVYISTPEGGGTGTLTTIPFSDTAKTGETFLVTALHVLDKRDSTGKKIGRFDTVSVSLNLSKGTKESRKYSLLLWSDKLDIAILYPIEFFRSFSEYDVTSPPLEMVASFQELRKGQTAFLAGYPYGVGTEGKTLNPVTQSGIIAYVDSTHSLVLIDIPVNHGNSGCPVYAVTDKGEAKLLGIVFEYQPSKQDYVYSIVLKKMVPVNTSLGRVVTIRSALSELYRLRH
jgi:hypothetical protein